MAGDGIFAVGLPWYVLSIGGSTSEVGLVVGAYGLPRMLLMTVGGSLSDRFSPAAVVVACDGLRATLGIVLAVLAGCHLGTYAIIPAVLSVGIFDALFLPASFSMIPRLVSVTELGFANAISVSSTRVASVVGPILGGAAVASVGVAWSFAVNALSFGLSALTAMPAWKNTVVSSSHGTVRRHAGLTSLLRDTPTLTLILFIFAIGNCAIGSIDQVALPILSNESSDSTASKALRLGVLLSSFGVGEIVGAIAALLIPDPSRPNLRAGLCYALAGIIITGIPMSDAPSVFISLLIAGGALLSIGNCWSQTAIQRAVPVDILGRVMGLVLTSSFGAVPVSAVIAGALIGDVGVYRYFLLAGIIFSLTNLIPMISKAFRDFGQPRVPQSALL